MYVYREESYEKMSRRAANFIAAQIISKPDTVLGLATGSTPLGTYKNLIEKCKAGDLDFSAVTTVNLDEYYRLPVTHDQSYRYFMNSNLFDHINIDKNNTFVPDGMNDDIDAECKAYDERIERLGGVDLQLLGIGHNGHIGFNEPDDVFTAATHKVTLTPSTMQANSRFFPNGGMPTHAVTMGMRSIMTAKKILIIAGPEKEQILREALTGPVTPHNPASVLQLHNNVTVIYVGSDNL